MENDDDIETDLKELNHMFMKIDDKIYNDECMQTD